MKRRTFLALAAPLRGAGRERRLRMDYTVTLSGIGAGSPVELWMPAPVSDAFQTISDLRIASPFGHQMHDGEDGNRFAHLRAARDGVVRMRFQALRRERVHALEKPSVSMEAPDCCLAPDRLVPVDGKIRQWAREVVRAAGARTDLEMGRAIYNHVVATVKYDKSGKGWGRGDIYYACDTRRGNCTDFHAIFIGYARALGVPARFAIGYPVPRDRGQGTIAGYHCWAEFYGRGFGWIPVDASEAAKDPSRREYYFGAHDENRVEFTRGRDIALQPAQGGERLNFFVDAYGERDGKKYGGVVTRVEYSDLS